MLATVRKPLVTAISWSEKENAHVATNARTITKELPKSTIAEKEKARIDPDQSPGRGHIRATRTVEAVKDVQALQDAEAIAESAVAVAIQIEAGLKVKLQKEKTVHILEAQALVADKTRGLA